MAAPACNIRLIVETVLKSHTAMAYCIECNAQGTPPHHGFSLLISVECVWRALSLSVLLYLIRCLEGITF